MKLLHTLLLLFKQELRTSCLVKLTVSVTALIQIFLFQHINLTLILYNAPNEPNKCFISEMKTLVFAAFKNKKKKLYFLREV